ncbi:MAG TPA: hypothetical protein VE441_01290 [Mycobacterium sp.]|nr:hypothetical protein [Mycobacterium sp.]
MITTALMNFGLDLFGFVAELWPSFLVVGCIAAACGGAVGSTTGGAQGVSTGSELWNAVHTVFQAASEMSVWFPWQLALCVLVGVVLMWVNAWILKTIRIVASFATAGGGSAG